ncbi:MAG: magnesium transporter [Thermonemataceae bacterium]|nr:magnesium transporter [Thermonemataceae bacterium]
MSEILSKEYLEKLQEALEQQDISFIKEQVEDLHYADITALAYELEEEQMSFLLCNLETEKASEVISELDEETRTNFFKKLPYQKLASYIDLMESDDAVDVLKEQDIQIREQIIATLSNREKARNIIHLLPYEEDTAGGLMAKEFIKANINWSVKQCIEEIRRQAERVEKIYSIYVVDEKGILKGRVSLKKIILSADNTLIADIYDDEELISVETYRRQDEVATLMRKYDLESIPVVNIQGKLLGRITIDDILDVIQEQSEAERQAMSGLSGDTEEDDTIWTSVKARLPWLLVGMVGGLLAASVTNMLGQPVIVLVSVLANFTTLIAGTGGNVGVQSSSIILQSLANKSVFELSTFQRLVKVFVIAILNGLILSTFVGVLSVIFGYEIKVALVVAVALLTVVLLASLTGTSTPLILNRLGINPALAAGPFITTANDLIGLTVYFLVARLIYQI